MPTASTAALAYHEPDIVTILIISSFLILGNVVNYAFDRLLFCGLIGQIAIGVAWGAPGAGILSQSVQDTVMQIGYLGLILIVYEGGLATDLKTLKSNLLLSFLVAFIGVTAPIGLSFTLRGFMDISLVQAFAAGAALCSTSLGTTFTILSTSGLGQTRLGVVLSSAAMMDDIVGLVMSGIISSLGQSSSFNVVTVIRPVFVSIAFALLVPLVCLWVVKPVTRKSMAAATERPPSRLQSTLTTEGAVVTLHTLILVAFVSGASYAGTSNLFAAYLAGAVVTWWDSLSSDIVDQDAAGSPSGMATKATNSGDVRDQDSAPNVDASQRAKQTTKSPSASSAGHGAATTMSATTHPVLAARQHLCGRRMLEKYYSPALQTILKPFFFASIGFSIPITRMFASAIVWRGVVYTVLMLTGKLICGLCLIRFDTKGLSLEALAKALPKSLSTCLPWPVRTALQQKKQCAPVPSDTTSSPPPNRPIAHARDAQASPSTRLNVPKPVSLYPAAMLGSAMIARGEIGFLISSVAESNGVFGSSAGGQSSELFLVVTWAILLCTLLGPITVGTMVRRVRKLQDEERSRRTGKSDPLGIWGFTSDAS